MSTSNLLPVLIGLALGFGAAGLGLFWQRRRDVRLLLDVRRKYPALQVFAVSLTIALKAFLRSDLPKRTIVGRLVFVFDENGLSLATRYSHTPQLVVGWSSVVAVRTGTGMVFGRAAPALAVELDDHSGSRTIVLPPMTVRNGLMAPMSANEVQELLVACDESIRSA
jgi:hypothetical protein